MTDLRQQNGPPLNKMLFCLNSTVWFQKRRPIQSAGAGLQRRVTLLLSLSLVRAAFWGVFPSFWGSGLSASSSVSVHCLLSTSTHDFMVLKLKAYDP